ncbi:sodium/potassium-transporting ATPase subunit alpha-like [Agrilus planipennis]|uniref:Sodium/potassium-transporting ATPase subunit alpha n=1 Tax=Agrilus planipennis TaxID=224129 RepID=A0A1W4WCX3_AGRPL|nr:sodium/potassium-transporting ATPase subunit alpha-like [Agrilus planipennis]
MFKRTRTRVSVRTSSSGRVQYSKTIVKEKDLEEIERDKAEYTTEDHIIELKVLLEKLRTNRKTGLTIDEADDRLKKYGPNCLVPNAAISKWSVLFHNFFGGFSSLLWMGSIMCFIGYAVARTSDPSVAEDKLYMGILLLIVVIVTGGYGFIQEVQSIKVIEGFANIVPKQATVIREGNEITLPAEELVVGDIVKFSMGNVVPADVRILEVQDLAVENSALTGESKPVGKSPDLTDINPMETENLAFFGTFVVQGTGKGVVIATGDKTAMGRIASLTTGIETQETEIKKDLKRFVHAITIIAFAIGIIFFVASLAIGYNIFQALLYFIGIVIANIPESLLITMTACLSLTAKRMKTKNCAIKNLQAIETLGSTSVICSDKTGTLTQNRMMVSHVFFDTIIHGVLNNQAYLNKKSEGLAALCRVATLCSRAEFKPGQENVPIDKREANGDATEIAVLKFVEKITGKTVQMKLDKPKVFEIPFNSSIKYQVSVHLKKDNQFLLVLKGAPERILNFCSTYYDGSAEVAMTATIKKSLEASVRNLGEMGERVLGFCDSQLPSQQYPPNFEFTSKNIPINNLRFVGLMSFLDPPRPNVPDAVARCKSAGIRVIMVTGDHPVTAAAVAKNVGILTDGNSPNFLTSTDDLTAVLQNDVESDIPSHIIVTGNDLRQLNAEELMVLVNSYQEIVFARTSPQQKLRIVEAFQQNGYIVAVTGDGVNDAPALKKANIGIAMGITGTDVAKEAADMILMDDNFASIVIGIEEGRLIFDNLKKSIAFLLTSNVPECVPFVLFVCCGIPQALSIIAIIAIDIGTDLWPSIALAYEKAEADIMLRKPRNYKEDKLVTWRLIVYAYFQIGLIQTFATMSCFFIMMSMHGWHIRSLMGIRDVWDNKVLNDVKDSYGIEWTYEERMTLQRRGFAVSYLTMVVTQIADLIVCKTRRLSIFQQGMSNWCLNLSIFFVLATAGLFVYTPAMKHVLQFEFVSWYFVMPSIPFGILIIIFDEVRKKLIRAKPGGWADRELYY